jgi:hypothetical protein
MSENIIHYRFQDEDPGRLQGEAALIVHTRHALTLVRGRKLTLPQKKEKFQRVGRDSCKKPEKLPTPLN